MAEYRVDINYSDLARLVNRLNQIEPALTRVMRSEWKEIVEPARARLTANLKAGPNPPLSGMRRRGSPVSKTWNNRGQSSRVQVQVRAGNKVISQMRNQTMLRLVIRSAATIIADMAGRGGKFMTPAGTKTDWYVYTNPMFANTYGPNSKPGFRRHTVTSQGEIMINKLNSRWGGSPSRKAYPSVEKSLPSVREKLAENIGNYIELTNRELGP
jgi:hypothetical protein